MRDIILNGEEVRWIHDQLAHAMVLNGYTPKVYDVLSGVMSFLTSKQDPTLISRIQQANDDFINEYIKEN